MSYCKIGTAADVCAAARAPNLLPVLVEIDDRPHASFDEKTWSVDHG